VGLLYGLTEYALVVLEPMLRWGPRSLGPEHWFWETLFLAIYVVSGALIGAAAALLGDSARRAAPRVVVATGLAVLFAGRILSAGLKPADLVLDAAVLLMIAMTLAGIFSPASMTWLSWMSSPWVSIPLAMAFIKAGARSSGAGGAAAALFVIWSVAAAVVLAASRTPRLQMALKDRFAPLTMAASLVLLPAFASLSFWLNAEPPIPAAKLAAASAGRPNILLIVLDTVRADHLSLYGYGRHTTPNLQALALESVVFRNAVSAADMTLSSYGAMYTSLYPSWHGALPIKANHLTGLDSSFLTLAEILSDHDYITLATLANNGYLNPEFGMHQGFQYYDVRGAVEQGGADFYLRDAIRPVLNLAVSTAELDRVYRRADQITDSGLRLFAAMRARKAPFFLSLNYMDAHEPYLPPAAYRGLFAGPGRDFDKSRLREVRAELAVHRRTPFTEAALRDFAAEYDGALAFMDAEIKRLLDGLKQTGLYDNTLIVVTADHGEALGERDDLNHPASVHQELVRIPLLIKYPRSFSAAPGQWVDGAVSGVDLMPTMLDVAGIPIQGNLQGRSLRNWGAAGDADRIVISESFTDTRQTRMAGRPTRAQRALYRGPWKLIASSTGEEELYNWSTDTAESRNLYGSERVIASQLSRRLQSWLRIVPHLKRSTKQMDRQGVERLRGLGYVQ